ncbi:MAG: NUDIX hydrolase [Thermomicrobiales bacterium]
MSHDEQRPARFYLPASVHLFLLRAGPRGQQVLLLRRANTGYQDGNYSVSAGHLDGGETLIAAIAREAHEEAGIAAAPADLAVVGVMHCWEGDEYIHFFLAASRWSGTIVNAEPEKCDDLSWHDLDNLPANVIPYVRQALANYRRGVWFDSFGWPDTHAPDQ